MYLRWLIQAFVEIYEYSKLASDFILAASVKYNTDFLYCIVKPQVIPWLVCPCYLKIRTFN